MARVLTENQMLLGEYLVAVGCEMGAVIKIISMLWDNEDGVIRMLEFCRDNPNAKQEQFVEVCESIAKKSTEKQCPKLRKRWQINWRKDK